MEKNSPNGGSVSELHAVIGVWYNRDLTYYVKRSRRMRYYPDVWSLFSIQVQPSELKDRYDLTRVRNIMERMSSERLGGVPINVRRFLDAGDSDHNPYERHVYLYLYEVDLPRAPMLNSEYYTSGAWLAAEEYEARSAGQPCGLCIRLWSDYAWLKGITDRPFVPREVVTS